MKRILYCLPLLLLTACPSPPVITDENEKIVDGNRLRIITGTTDGGRFVRVENVEKRWVGRFKGGREKWRDRQFELGDVAEGEIHKICGTWYYQLLRQFIYGMLDKDETMGGIAPVLGVTASMAAYLAAAASTEDANVPVSVYGEFRCRADNSH